MRGLTARGLALGLSLLCGLLDHDARAEAGSIERLTRPVLDFYSRRAWSGRIPILGHASVTDEGMRAALAAVDLLLAHAPRLRARLEEAGHELHVIALRQFTSDLPEHRDDRGTRLGAGPASGQLFDWHMISGQIIGRYSSCTEAMLIGVVGHRLFGTDMCMHELAHAVESRGLDARLRDEIETRYHRSLGNKLWKGQYAASNPHEWFAELTRFYFHVDPHLDFYDPALAHDRAWLKTYDPEGYAFVDELYGDRVDPGRAPAPLPLRPGREESGLSSPRSEQPVHLIVRNETKSPLRVVWIDFAGHRDTRAFAKVITPPGAERDIDAYVGHTWTITDLEGKALCTFVAPKEDARAIVKAPCE